MAADYAYREFAERELDFRKRLNYPPFSRLIRFIVTGTEQEKLEKHVQQEKEILEDIFRVNGLPASVMAAPAMVPKIGPNYYYHVLLRSPDPHQVFQYWKPPVGWRVDIDPIHAT